MKKTLVAILLALAQLILSQGFLHEHGAPTFWVTLAQKEDQRP